jgi:paired amphipathic helix protein Sin3a
MFELSSMRSTQEAENTSSGRDELCNEVLTDKWVSHSTRASEDPGFVSHQKNEFEEILHQIEEDRHDYDVNIEANLHTIQLLEPIALRLATMSADEKSRFRLAPGLGGQSKTIYQRVIKTVWGREAGLEVIDALHNDPVRAVPLVLIRLKKQDEEWKAARREWQKTWRDDTARVFWKSLDHQGVSIKKTDKHQFQLKTLVGEIMAKREEQMDGPLYPTTPVAEYQFSYDFKDANIILDVSRLLAVSLENSSAFSISDRKRIDYFTKSFIPLFFGRKSKNVEDTIDWVSHKTRDDEGDSESANRREGHRGAQADTGTEDHLRDVFTRGEEKVVRKREEESVTSYPSSSDSSQEPQHGDIVMPLPRYSERTVFTLFCDATIYGFFRAFQILYDRLAAVKATEDLMCAEVERQKTVQVADGMNISTHRGKSVFPDTSQTANYYNQILDMCEKVLQGELDAAAFEDSLRSVNLQQGWKLFTVEKTCNSILKFVQSIVASDGNGKNPEKKKSADIILQFQKDRDRRQCEEEGGEDIELIAYRRAVEGILRQSDELYRIDWVRVHCLSVTPERVTDGRDSTRPTRRRPLD